MRRLLEAECDAPYRYERVEERLVVMEPSDLPHIQVVSAILEKLYVYRTYPFGED